MSEERFKLSSHLPYIYHVEVQVNATALGVSECKPVTRYGVEEKDRERRQSEAGGGGGRGWGLPSPGGSPARGAWGSTWVTVFWCGATQSLSSGPGT